MTAEARLFRGVLAPAAEPVPAGAQVLVTVWADGDAEVAFRGDDHDRWGVPTNVSEVTP